MTEIVLKVPTQAALRKKWKQHIKHGVLFAPVHPVPTEGADVIVRIQPGFSPELVMIQGYVAQASVGISVIQLRGLDPTARRKLVELGIPEAADALVGDEAKTTGSVTPVDGPVPEEEPPPSPSPAEPPPEPSLGAPADEPESPGVDTNVFAPSPETETTDVGAAPTEAEPSAAPAAAPFKPKAGAFKPGAAKFKPKAAAFKPGAAKFSPGASPFRPKAAGPGGAPRQAPPKVGDLTDVRVLAAIDGPATAAAEALLPAPSARGSFGDETWRDVVLRLTTGRTTGIVVVSAFREIRWAYFVDGGPVHFAGEKPHAGEFLSDALLLDEAVTGDQWLDAVRMSKLLGVRPGEYLVSQGTLSRDALDAALTKRAERITRNLIGTNFGSWSIHDVPAVRTVFTNTPVNAVDVLMAAERKTQADRDDELIIRECEPFYRKHVKLIPDRAELLERIELRPNERRVVTEMLAAGWTIGELVAYGGMLERPLLRLLEALRGMGLVEYVDEEGEISKRNRAERILWIGLRDLDRRSVFEAVYAHWSSTPWEIEKGYKRLLSELGAERFGDVADPRINDLVRKIRTKADAIYEQLSDRSGRREARKGHVGSDQLLMAVELLDKQAQLALWKADFAFAKACYERVLDLDPGVAEASEARRNARKAMADPRVATAQEPGEARLRQLYAEVDALVED